MSEEAYKNYIEIQAEIDRVIDEAVMRRIALEKEQEKYRDGYIWYERQRAAKATASRKDLQTRKIEWCRDNLKPGTFVKMSGTRDGNGIRCVIEMNKYNTLIMNYARNGYRTVNRETGKRGWKEPTADHGVVEQSAGKITQVYNPETQRWDKVTDLMKQ